MEYVLYGDYGSGASCIAAALTLAGVPYAFRRISISGGEQTSPEFLAVNPCGKVPALRLPDGSVLTETVAMLLTLSERYPDAGLLPPVGTPARAQALRWMVFLASEVYPAIETEDYPERFTPSGGDVAAVRDMAQTRVREKMRLAEAAIAGPWFLLQTFSILDFYLAMFARWIFPKGWYVEHLPKTAGIVAAMETHPVLGPLWAQHFPPQPTQDR